jgi:hypothetical protein
VRFNAAMRCRVDALRSDAGPSLSKARELVRLGRAEIVGYVPLRRRNEMGIIPTDKFVVHTEAEAAQAKAQMAARPGPAMTAVIIVLRRDNSARSSSRR